MFTSHQTIFNDARHLKTLEPNSIDLIVTSPPYPMIEMWDQTFALLNLETYEALNQKQGAKAFELMHQELDKVWEKAYQVLKPGGFLCINIGDAVRTVQTFQLYSNQARIITKCVALGLIPLPKILWRKQTNAPNKFMGAGMLPAGAYVTLEHEYILIFRKGDKRTFSKTVDKAKRRQSAFFWEERNQWFSDIWDDLKGIRQKITQQALRKRSGAFPFELAYRLINMYSLQGDTVLDPFCGTATTQLAAAFSARNSIGFEIDQSFATILNEKFKNVVHLANEQITNRLAKHRHFIKTKKETGYQFKHYHKFYQFAVMTRQETEIRFPFLVSKKQTQKDLITIEYDSQITIPLERLF